MTTPLTLALDGTPGPAERSYWVVRGRLAGGGYPESPEPELRGARIEALWRAGVRTFIDLTEEGEANLVGAPLVPYGVTVRKLAGHGGEGSSCLRLPIRDLDVPTRDGMRTILEAIDLSLAASRPVFVHCLGGVGRTGTVLACWLLRHGLATKGDVLATLARLRHADAVRGMRPSPETAAQRELVLGWAELAS